MGNFLHFLKEEEEGEKLKHITHAEDRPLQSGSKGFTHAYNALNQAHEHTKSGGDSSGLTMKYDGSPAIVFGHNPENGKFFVASKSAFNKNPKLNYSHKDIEKNHGHAPGLMEKLHSALNHLPKVAPKSGVYQGDMMYSENDKKDEGNGKVSFTPNTITYTASGAKADKIKRSKMGVVVHQQYHGDTLHSMKADPHPDVHNFKEHPDVWHQSASHDTKNVHYSPEDQKEFEGHMADAKKIHSEHGKQMYNATQPHQGESGHLETYINSTVRSGEKPSAEGFKKHVEEKYKKLADKLKTPAGKSKRMAESKMHTDHIEKNKKQYDNLLKMHGHLQAAKNVLVKTLEQHEGGLEHHIDGKPSKPEGFVVNHAGEPTKLVNREEFAKANLLKVRAKSAPPAKSEPAAEKKEEKPATKKKLKEYKLNENEKLTLKKGDHHPDTHVLTHHHSSGKKRIAGVFSQFTPEELEEHLKEHHGLE